MSSKTGPLPNKPALARQQRRHFPAHELVADRLVAVRIELVCIAHLPRAAGAAVVVAHRPTLGLELPLGGAESIAVFILGAADFARAADSVDLEDGVIWAVDVGVDA